MTAYKNFIDDFPMRCRDVLRLAGKPARLQGREVTLSLMVASAGFVLPYERLKPAGEHGDHPSGDSRTFANACTKLASLLNEPFLSSVLWGELDSTWHHGKLDSLSGCPESWEGLEKRKPFGRDKTVGATLNVIRNALAHGNIYTWNNPIDAIIFIKRNYDGNNITKRFSLIFVSPQDFLKFLAKWFDFLSDFRIPMEAAIQAFKQAA